MKKAILLLSAILPLAGCMTSGTNLHGDFTCRAPNGTCAPMSAIDAKAVADIGVGPQSIGGQDTVTIPSGGRMLTVAAADAQAAVVPARTGRTGAEGGVSRAHRCERCLSRRSLRPCRR